MYLPNSPSSPAGPTNRWRIYFLAALAAASVAAIVIQPPRLGLDLRGGSSLTLQVKGEGPPDATLLAQVQHVIERRINEHGLAESTVQPAGSNHDRLLLQIPAGADMARIRRAIERPGTLEWYAVAGGPYASQAEAGAAEPLTKLFPSERGWLALRAPAVVRGLDLKNARAARGEFGGSAVEFTLSAEAGKRFAAFTAAHMGKQTAIVIDGRVLSAPVIESEIGDSGQIRGSMSVEEAEDLAINLRAGAMPASVTVMHETTVAATLGADSVRHGIEAGAVSLTAVAAAMVAYYGRAGINAVTALVLNGLLLIAALALAGAVLTMPGIAGLILTIGLAVDSNVLVFERIRETGSVSEGFSRAWTTIVDTHVTTLVSSALLYAFGTASIRGFAVTLVIGLLTNVFTSVYASRALFDSGWRIFDARGLIKEIAPACS